MSPACSFPICISHLSLFCVGSIPHRADSSWTQQAVAALSPRLRQVRSECLPRGEEAGIPGENGRISTEEIETDYKSHVYYYFFFFSESNTSLIVVLK